MKTVATWAILVTGLLILLYVAIAWVSVIVILRPFGGVPLSWEFARGNAYWLVLTLVGVVLVAVSASRLMRPRGPVDRGRAGP